MKKVLLSEQAIVSLLWGPWANVQFTDLSKLTGLPIKRLQELASRPNPSQSATGDDLG